MQHAKRLAPQIAHTIAEEIGAQTAQALAAIALLDEGASVPFIARYRKEVNAGLDDTSCATGNTADLPARVEVARHGNGRIAEQGKLTDELCADIEAADSKARLEDL